MSRGAHELEPAKLYEDVLHSTSLKPIGASRISAIQIFLWSSDSQTLVVVVLLLLLVAILRSSSRSSSGSSSSSRE